MKPAHFPVDMVGSNDSTLVIVVVSIVGGLAMVCAIVAGVVAITKIAVRHRERMARIGMGLDPDALDNFSSLPPLPSQPSSNPPSSTQAWDQFPVARTQAPPKA
jgi:hypothetical protein